MELISKPEEWAINLYGNTIYNNEYKMSDYCITIEYDDGYILFQTITWTILFLQKKEYENKFQNDFLLETKIIVNKEIEENKIAEQAYLQRATIKIKNEYENINNYIILTTNECNANCPYCYETLKKGKMSKETAESLIDFIDKKHNDIVSLTWFGGEPMMNSLLIDYISKSLYEKKIKFSTTMITNLFSFTEEYFEKSENLWNLKHIQVTLDGSEEYYNKIKNFNFNGSSFNRILNNIKGILENTKITLTIRINVSDENIDLIDKLCETLINELKQYDKKRYNFDIHEIFQMNENASLLKENDFYLKLYDLQKKYDGNKRKTMVLKQNLLHCFSDKCTCAVVATNGNLHNCEQYLPLMPEIHQHL